MRIPLSWLQTFFEEDLPHTDELVHAFLDLGLSPEEVIELPGPPAGVKTARVVSVTPLTEQLTDVVVTHGDTEYRVVCGAPNVAAGQVVAHVMPGASLTLGEIGVRDIQGVTSHGMLASPTELGLYDYSGGLLELPIGTPLGQELAELWPAETVIVLEVTPNRADAFSVLGVARDLAAKLDKNLIDVTPPVTDLPEEEAVVITINDAHPENGFSARIIDGLQVEPSPIWVQRHLAAVGQRPLNNVVDVTNYVMFELGQPTHAYDLNVLETDDEGRATIGVRRAESGEQLRLLNDDEIELTADDVVIYTGTDLGRPIGLAGVMGGSDDSIESTTTSVLLEVASFDHVAIRLNGKRHKLLSEARTRFERGVDPALPEAASARVVALLEQIAGGTARPGFTWQRANTDRPTITFDPARVEFLTAVAVPLDAQQGILERLGCTVEVIDGTWRVTPPTWRYDMNIEEDVVEEVIRLHGYEHIGLSRPDMFFTPAETDPTFFGLRTDLVAMGFQELISYVFTGPKHLAATNAPEAAVELSEPQGVERSVLRTALYPSLIDAAQVNRRESQLALFEIGRVFLGDVEEERLALLLSGERFGNGWSTSIPADFYALKGVLERLAKGLGVTCTVEPSSEPHLHPGVAGTVIWDEKPIGTIGQLHPSIAAEFELPPTWIAEVRMPLAGANLQFTDIVRQPYNERDLAIIVPSTVTFHELASLCVAHGGEKLESVKPFDVFASEERLGAGLKSVAVRLQFRDATRALRDEEVDSFVTNILAALHERGYEIRK